MMCLNNQVPVGFALWERKEWALVRKGSHGGSSIYLYCILVDPEGPVVFFCFLYLTVSSLKTEIGFIHDQTTSSLHRHIHSGKEKKERREERRKKGREKGRKTWASSFDLPNCLWTLHKFFNFSQH